MILKANEVVGAGPQVFLTKLYHRVGHPTRSGIAQSHRFHRSETKRVGSTARQLFKGQATFKIVRLVEIVALVLLRPPTALGGSADTQVLKTGS